MGMEADDTCIARGRQLAKAFLDQARADHGLPISQNAVEVTRLVVSELITNAVKYAPGPMILTLRVTSEVVEVAVWDSNPTLPIARAADTGRVGQHGLEIVLMVAQGFEAQREPVGKRVTARIGLADHRDK